MTRGAFREWWLERKVAYYRAQLRFLYWLRDKLRG